MKKTVKKIQKQDGTYIINQRDILCELQKFYSNLYRSRDNELLDVNLTEYLSDCDTYILTPVEANKLEGKITEDELCFALKNMNNHKTPGIDGFPAEFF